MTQKEIIQTLLEERFSVKVHFDEIKMCIRDRLKGLEKRKHNLEAKLEKVEHAIKSRTDDVVDFKQMGIDHIFIRCV